MSILFELSKIIKRGKPAPAFCPVCGSGLMRRSSSLDGWFLPTRHVCEECGYTGYLVLELEKG